MILISPDVARRGDENDALDPSPSEAPNRSTAARRGSKAGKRRPPSVEEMRASIEKGIREQSEILADLAEMGLDCMPDYFFDHLGIVRQRLSALWSAAFRLSLDPPDVRGALAFWHPADVAPRGIEEERDSAAFVDENGDGPAIGAWTATAVDEGQLDLFGEGE